MKKDPVLAGSLQSRRLESNQHPHQIEERIELSGRDISHGHHGSLSITGKVFGVNEKGPCFHKVPLLA